MYIVPKYVVCKAHFMCFVHVEMVDIFFCDSVFQMSNIEMIRYVVPPQIPVCTLVLYMCPKHVFICVSSAEWAVAASLVPRPTPFVVAQGRQRAWYLFSHA